MALTTDQRKLALALYERHHRVFDELIEVLLAEGLLATTAHSVPAGRNLGRIAVRIGDQVIEGTTVASLFSAALKLLLDKGALSSLPLPWGDTVTRYLLTNRVPAEHPNGRPFFYPVTDRGYTIETHYSRERAIRALSALCGALEIAIESIPTT